MAVAATELMALPPQAANHTVRATSSGRATPSVRARPSRRTYRRRRAVAAGLVVGLVLAVGAALGILGAGALPVPERPGSLPPAVAAPAVYVVQPGDTFWSIARKLNPKADPRPLVDRLVAAHGGATLHVGERIPIPR